MKLRDKIIYLGKGSLFSKAISLFSFFFVTKILSLESFSLYVIYLFISELILLILTHGLGSYIIRGSSSNAKNKVFPESIFLTVITVLIFWLFISAIPTQFIAFLPDSYAELLEFQHLIMFTLLGKGLVNICNGYFLSTHQARSHAKLNIRSSAAYFSTLLIGYFVMNFRGLELVFISLCVTSAFSVIYAYSLVRKDVNIKMTSIGDLIFLLRGSYPFLLKNLIGIVGLYLSRLILDIMATREELAIYSFYLMILLQLSIFSRILSEALMPTIRDNFKKIDILEKVVNEYIKNFFLFSLLILLFSFFISFLISNNYLAFLQLFINWKYLDNIWIFNILLVCALINMPRAIIFDAWQYYGNIKVGLRLIIVATVNLILGIVLYPAAYYVGKIYGVALAYLLITCIMTYIAYYNFNFAKERAKIEASIHNC